MVLVRHAENDYVRSARLAGHTQGVHLNDRGRIQANNLGNRLSSVPIKAIYSSPLERAVETAQATLAHHRRLALILEPRLIEVDYGKWTGKRLRFLSRTRLWQNIQLRPSTVRFPDGEGLREMQCRAIEAMDAIVGTFPRGTVVAVSHGDVIKSLVAHYLGLHLDLFQRIEVAPASISIIEIRNSGAVIVRLNDTCHCDYPASYQAA